MGKNKNKVEKKAKQKNTAAIDERVKKAMSAQPPDENPYKMENENLIDRFRNLHRTDRDSIKKKARLKSRVNRKKKPQGPKF